MDTVNFINYIKNPGKLNQVSFQELNNLIETYPYCQNLHYLALMKAKYEQHKDYDKRLNLVATYCPDRNFLFKQLQRSSEAQGDSDHTTQDPSVVIDHQHSVAPMAAAAVIAPIVIPPTPPEEELPKAPTPDPVEPESPQSIEAANPNATVNIVEDESGSEVIVTKANMNEVEGEKRDVVFLEDLFDKVEPDEIDQPESVVEKIEPIVEQPIEVPPPSEELDHALEETFQEDEIVIADGNSPSAETGASSDSTDESPLRESVENLKPPLGLHDEAEPANEEDSSTDKEIRSNDKIPFEVVIDPINDPKIGIDNNPDTEGWQQGDSAPSPSEEPIVTKTPIEQSEPFSVKEEKIIMSEDEDEPIMEEPEEESEAPTEKTTKDDSDGDQIPLIAPLPKTAFKSWYEPAPPKEDTVEEAKEAVVQEQEEVVNTKTLEEEKVTAVPNDEVEATKSPDIAIQKVITDTFSFEEEAVEVEEVTQVEKSKKKKKDKKSKKKKKELMDTEETSVVNKKDKKKDKKKAKKKKRKKIKNLAKQSLTMHDDLISETLAAILVEQGSNKKAIKMYKVLINLFPERADFYQKQIKKLSKSK